MAKKTLKLKGGLDAGTAVADKPSNIEPDLQYPVDGETAQNALIEAGINDVMAVGNLDVTFYHGQTPIAVLGSPQDYSPKSNPGQRRQFANLPAQFARGGGRAPGLSVVNDWVSVMGLKLPGNVGSVIRAIARYGDTDHRDAHASKLAADAGHGSPSMASRISRLSPAARAELKALL